MDCVNAFQKPAQDEMLWSFMASENHLANVLKPEQVGVTVRQRHCHTAPTSNAIALPKSWTNIRCPPDFTVITKLTERIQSGLKYQLMTYYTTARERIYDN